MWCFPGDRREFPTVAVRELLRFYPFYWIFLENFITSFRHVDCKPTPGTCHKVPTTLDKLGRRPFVEDMTQDISNDEKVALLSEDIRAACGDRYQIDSMLGAGAFGEVYKALDTLLNRSVALKRIRPDFFANASQTDELRLRFLREAQVAVAPGIGFGEFGEGFVRLGLVENEQRIRQAVRNIKRFLSSPAQAKSAHQAREK